MATFYDFDGCLEYSRGQRKATDIETIMSRIPGCVSVVETNAGRDDHGIDYIATLRGCSLINIDTKTRTPGCSRWWKSAPLFRDDGLNVLEPELSLEQWSVIGENGNPAKTGWTLDESKLTHYTLHVFDPSDSDEAIILPFQLLRVAFRNNLDRWYRSCRVDRQTTKRNGREWRSECVFVPAWCVIDAIAFEMRPVKP